MQEDKAFTEQDAVQQRMNHIQEEKRSLREYMLHLDREYHALLDRLHWYAERDILVQAPPPQTITETPTVEASSTKEVALDDTTEIENNPSEQTQSTPSTLSDTNTKDRSLIISSLAGKISKTQRARKKDMQHLIYHIVKDYGGIMRKRKIADKLYELTGRKIATLSKVLSDIVEEHEGFERVGRGRYRVTGEIHFDETDLKGKINYPNYEEMARFIIPMLEKQGPMTAKEIEKAVSGKFDVTFSRFHNSLRGVRNYAPKIQLQDGFYQINQPVADQTDEFFKESTSQFNEEQQDKIRRFKIDAASRPKRLSIERVTSEIFEILKGEVRPIRVRELENKLYDRINQKWENFYQVLDKVCTINPNIEKFGYGRVRLSEKARRRASLK